MPVRSRILPIDPWQSPFIDPFARVFSGPGLVADLIHNRVYGGSPPLAIAPGERSIPAHTPLPVGDRSAPPPVPPIVPLPPIPTLPEVAAGRDSEGLECIYPGGCDHPPTDWGEVYEGFVDLNEPPPGTPDAPVVIPTPGGQLPPPEFVDLEDPLEHPPTTEEPMAADWGDFAQTTIQNVISGLVNPAATPAPLATPVPTTPTEVTYNTRTGQIKPCRRRRRRRLLTPTDLSDLAALQALVGKGSSALNMAVAKAVRR